MNYDVEDNSDEEFTRSSEDEEKSDEDFFHN